MKMKFYPPFVDEGEEVAGWGEARLIKYLDGRCELRGGSDQDRADARQWIAQFWSGPVAGLDSTPAPRGAAGGPKP